MLDENVKSSGRVHLSQKELTDDDNFSITMSNITDTGPVKNQVYNEEIDMEQKDKYDGAIDGMSSIGDSESHNPEMNLFGDGLDNLDSFDQIGILPDNLLINDQAFG